MKTLAKISFVLSSFLDFTGIIRAQEEQHRTIRGTVVPEDQFWYFCGAGSYLEIKYIIGKVF